MWTSGGGGGGGLRVLQIHQLGLVQQAKVGGGGCPLGAARVLRAAFLPP